VILNDTTDKNGLLQRAEFYTNLGLGNITGDTERKKEFINHINVAQHDLFMMALEAQDGWDVDDPNHTDRKYFTVPLTTNRDYTFAVTERILDFERIDVAYDGEDYNRAEPVDTREMDFGLGDDDDVDSHFSKINPRYDTRGNQILLYPKATQEDVNNNGKMRLEWTRESLEFARDGSDDSREPFLPRPFHEQVAIRAAYKWLIVNKPDNKSLLSRLESEIGRVKDQLKDYYGTREADRTYRFTSEVKFQHYR
jgi:hypothetical protein